MGHITLEEAKTANVIVKLKLYWQALHMYVFHGSISNWKDMAAAGVFIACMEGFLIWFNYSYDEFFVPIFCVVTGLYLALWMYFQIYSFAMNKRVRPEPQKLGYIDDIKIVNEAIRNGDYRTYSRMLLKWKGAPSQKKCDKLIASLDDGFIREHPKIKEIIESNRRWADGENGQYRGAVQLCKADYLQIENTHKNAKGQSGE